jgi:hypothetical protein
MDSTQMQQPKLPFVFLVAQESTVIKTAKPRWSRAKIVQRAGIPLLQAYQVLMVVTIVLRANIQQKKAILNRPNVKLVKEDTFKIYQGPPCVVNAPVGGEIF